MWFSTTDSIIPIFQSGSAILSASSESNPFRWTLRYSAAIFLVDCNLEPAIPLIPNVFASFVPITTISTAIAPSHAPPDTTRGAGSMMDSAGRRIATERTVNTIPFPIA